MPWILPPDEMSSAPLQEASSAGIAPTNVSLALKLVLSRSGRRLARADEASTDKIRHPYDSAERGGETKGG
ncbi:MAG: hypothetical protein AMXMBFR56_81940 [Polyangiaceae bacterium]